MNKSIGKKKRDEELNREKGEEIKKSSERRWSMEDQDKERTERV